MYVVNKIQNPKLAEKIAFALPVFYRKPAIFKRLITSNPGIIQDETSCVALCIFMSIMVFYIEVDHIFKYTCEYFKKLIIELKSRPDIVQLALPNIYSIEYLLLKLRSVEDDTALVLLGLLKVILLVQVRRIYRISSGCKK